MDAKKYLSLYNGDKDKAIDRLNHSISLYENSPNKLNEKAQSRIKKYKELINQILNQ